MSASKTKVPATNLQTIEPTWPLARWGIDIIGKLPAAQGNLQYAVVAVEYFTKWIEAKPVTNMSFSYNKKISLAKHHMSLRNSKAHNSR
jgi:hypothetical protein